MHKDDQYDDSESAYVTGTLVNPESGAYAVSQNL